MRGVGGRAAVRRDGRLLGLLPRMLVALVVVLLLAAGEYVATLIWEAMRPCGFFLVDVFSQDSNSLFWIQKIAPRRLS